LGQAGRRTNCQGSQAEPSGCPSAVVDRFELAAIDRDARFRKQAHLAAEFDEPHLPIFA
jgi:hypothetical protein